MFDTNKLSLAARPGRLLGLIFLKLYLVCFMYVWCPSLGYTVLIVTRNHFQHTSFQTICKFSISSYVSKCIGRTFPVHFPTTSLETLTLKLVCTGITE